MFFHGRDAISAEEAEAIKRALLATLGDELSANTMSGYAYGVLIGLLNKAGFLETTFAVAFTNHVTALVTDALRGLRLIGSGNTEGSIGGSRSRRT